MFKELLELWSDETSFLDEIMRDFEEMIRLAHRMYDQVTNALFENQTMEGLKKEIYTSDGQLNADEQSIRRKIFTQLSAKSDEPIASCLILMSISKDVERLGDYAKNILEVFEVKSKLEHTEPYFGRLLTLKKEISTMFDEVHKAYRESDKKKARALVRKSYELQKLCDENVRQLLTADPGEDHVAYTLLSRFFKRSLAHLSNIATSIFMPITKIDFFSPSRRDELMGVEP